MVRAFGRVDAPSQSTKDPEQGQELIMRLLGSWDDLGQHPDGETRCTWRLKLHYVQALRVIQPKVIHVEYMPQARDVRSSLGKNTLYCSGVRLDFHTALSLARHLLHWNMYSITNPLCCRCQGGLCSQEAVESKSMVR